MSSAGLPPIFAETPIALVPAKTIATFPANTFLESIVVSPENILFVSNHYDGSVWRITPTGEATLYARIDGKATGLVWLPDGQLLLSGWDAGNVSTVFQIAPDGKADVLLSMPDAIFLNGLTLLSDDRVLIADSYRGAIWQLNLSNQTVDIWLEHPAIARSNPDSVFPAVNGLKIFDQVLYASNTEKMQLVKIPIINGQPGEPQIFVAPVNLDDFAFDQQGNLYGTTHIYNSVVKITPDGRMSVIAEAEAGMTGSTALAFGRDLDDRIGIYVVTNGGMSLPPATGVEPAKVVRLEIGIPGLTLGKTPVGGI